jgi:hypothetical protein
VDELPQDVLATIAGALSPSREDAEVAGALDRVQLPEPFRVYVAILLLRRDPHLSIEKVPQTIAHIRRQDASVATVLYEARWNEPTIRGASALLRITTLAGGDAATLMTVTTGPVWRHGLEKAFAWLYPTVYAPFLRQPDLRSVFESMQRALRSPLRIRLTRVSSLRRLLHTPSRRRYESGLTWTDVDAEEAFADAAESSTYFRSLAFDLCDVQGKGRFVSTDIVGKVSRDAYFSSNARIAWLYNTAVVAALARVRKEQEIARNRGRLAAKGPEPRAILARFDTGSLQRQDLPRIAERLRRMPSASVSILHGNPYLHAAIVDMKDGSAFDLLVASEKQLLIVPQLRATEPSVVRICRYVYDQVGEAEFVDASHELGLR